MGVSIGPARLKASQPVSKPPDGFKTGRIGNRSVTMYAFSGKRDKLHSSIYIVCSRTLLDQGGGGGLPVMDTCSAPALRLKAVLEAQQKGQLAAGAGTPRTTREARIKLKALNDAVVKLSSRLEETEREKEQLRAQLERSLGEGVRSEGVGGVHGETGVRGAIADRYADCRKEEMLSAVVDLELVSKGEREGGWIYSE